MKHMIAEESKPDSLYGNINFSWYPSDLEDFRNRIQRTAHLPFFFWFLGRGSRLQAAGCSNVGAAFATSYQN